MKPYFYIGGLLFLAFCLFIGNLVLGSVSIPAECGWDILLGNEVEKSVGLISYCSLVFLRRLRHFLPERLWQFQV